MLCIEEKQRKKFHVLYNRNERKQEKLIKKRLKKRVNVKSKCELFIVLLVLLSPEDINCIKQL